MTTVKNQSIFTIRRAKIVAIIVALALFWTWMFPSVTLRYRLTYEVDVDGKVHTGSSVMQAGMYAGPLCGGLGWAPCWSFMGEAVAVDLGPRGVLFSLLAGSSKRGAKNPISGWPLPQVEHVQFLPVYVMRRAGLWKAPPGYTGGSVGEWQAAEKLRTTVELAPYEIPELVRFRDLNDPTTAEVVDPADMTKSFGPGVRFMRATITFVDPGWWPMSYAGAFGVPFARWLGGGEPVTRGIEGRLPAILAGVEKYNRMVIDPRNPQGFNPNTGHFVRK